MRGEGEEGATHGVLPKGSTSLKVRSTTRGSTTWSNRRSSLLRKTTSIPSLSYFVLRVPVQVRGCEREREAPQSETRATGAHHFSTTPMSASPTCFQWSTIEGESVSRRPKSGVRQDWRLERGEQPRGESGRTVDDEHQVVLSQRGQPVFDAAPPRRRGSPRGSARWRRGRCRCRHMGEGLRLSRGGGGQGGHGLVRRGGRERGVPERERREVRRGCDVL